MIITKNKNGVTEIKNTNTGDKRDMVLITKGTDLTGPVHLEGKKVYLGYNEVVECEHEDTALDLFLAVVDVMEA